MIFLISLVVFAILLAFVHNQRQRQRAEQWLGAQYATARILAETITLDEAIPSILQAICESLNWDLAEFWLVDPPAGLLRHVDSWSAPSAKLAEFELGSQALTFAPGIGLVGQVWESGEAVWIADVTQHREFIRANIAAKSGLSAAFGLPIRIGNQVVGVMAFFSRKIHQPEPDLLQMLTAVGGLVGQFIKRKRVEQALQGITHDVSSSASTGFFQSLVQNLNTVLEVDYVFVGKLANGEKSRVSTVAICADGKLVDNLEYELAHTPCQNIVCQNGAGKALCSYPQGVQQLFPQDPLLAEMAVEAYVGIPLFSSAQEVLGLLVVMNRRAIADPSFVESMLQIFASRAAAELERQQAEAALREREELLRMALGSAKMGAWEWNISTGKEKWSPEVAAIFGVELGGVVPHYDDFFQRIHPDDRPLVEQAQNRTLQEGLQYNAEYRIFWDDGSLHWVNSQGNVLLDQEGRPYILSGVTMDITDRKRAELSLQQAEEKYRSIFENAVDGIFQTTPEGKYISANPALAQIYGYKTAEELIVSLSNQIDHQLYVDPNRRQAFIELLNRHGSVTDFESQVYRRDGRIIWISESARVVRDRDGIPLHYEGVVIDITGRKQAAADLSNAKEAAEAASRAKSQFLANMSHELRTPLNAIIGYSEMLQEDAVDLGYSDIIPDLEKIHTAGNHLLGLINDILDISKIEAGKMALFLEPFSIQSMIDEVKTTVRPLIEKNNNTLVIDCPDDLGTMHADLTKVRQILLNLLSNASKFTKRGTVTLSIAKVEAMGESRGEDNKSPLLAPPSSPWFTFQVTDTGIGMTEIQMAQLFQAFSQADASTTRKYGGTGLGLAISHRFCQMMQGDISVTSDLGRGSRFTVRLPVDVSDALQDEPSHSLHSEPTIGQANDPVERAHGTDAIATKPGSNPQSSSGKPSAAMPLKDLRVLIIDDEPTVRDLMARYLSKEGFQVDTASSGQEGIFLAKQLRPDAITLDVMMPTMDGWQVLSALKADPELAEIPVIVLTIVDNKNRGLALGAADYLTKPVDYKRLATLLAKYQPQRNAETTLPVGQVLIAEDDPATRELFRQFLTRQGWAITEAENGRIALEKIATQVPDLILLDLMMPEMDGFQFIHELRCWPQYQQIPVVVVTAMDLTPADRRQLYGDVEQILEKGGHNQDSLLQEVRDLVVHYIGQRFSLEEATIHG